MDTVKRASLRSPRTSVALGLVVVLSAFAAAAANAQESAADTAQDSGAATAPQSSGRPSIDFFLQPEARVSRVGGGTAVASGFNTGWVINRKLILGGASFSTNYGVEPTVTTLDGDRKADFRYRGGLVGWNFKHNPTVSTSVTSVIGRGSLQASYNDRAVMADKFWVFEPMANVNVRVNRWAKVSAGAGYRFVTGGQFAGVDKADVRSPTARIGVSVGGF